VTDRARRWGLRLLAVIGALTVWFFSSVEKRERISEKVVDASVTYNLPRGTILLDPIQTVKVRLRGPDRQLRNLSPWAVDVVVDVREAVVGGIDVAHLSPDDVERPDPLEAISVEPNSVPVRLDVEVVRVLPVVPRIVGEPAGGSVPGVVSTRPENAQIRGPQSLIANLDSVTTSPVTLDGHAFSFDQTVSVIPPDPLVRIVQPAAVIVRVPMMVPDPDSPDGVRERLSER